MGHQCSHSKFLIITLELDNINVDNGMNENEWFGERFLTDGSLNNVNYCHQDLTREHSGETSKSLEQL